MRSRLFVLVGLLALTLGPTQGFTQFPGGDGRGQPSWSGRDFGGRLPFGDARDANGRPSWGGGNPFGGRGFASDGRDASGRSFWGGNNAPGGRLSGNDGGPWGSRPFGSGGPTGGFDRGRMLDLLSSGGAGAVRTQMGPMAQQLLDRFGQRMGDTGGPMTRDQFQSFIQQRMSQGFGGPAGGPPMALFGGSGSGPDSRRGSGGWNPEAIADTMFRRLDLNGDGLLNYDEMSDEVRAERGRYDSNGDGFLDRNEYRAYFQARMQQRLAERGGDPSWMPGAALDQEEGQKPVVYRSGRLPNNLPPWFIQLDTDTDAQVGLYEWRRSGESLDRFSEMDSNNDGFLTVAEVLRYMGQSSNRSGPGAAMDGFARTGDEPWGRGGDRGGFGAGPWGRGGDRGGFGAGPWGRGDDRRGDSPRGFMGRDGSERGGGEPFRGFMGRGGDDRRGDSPRGFMGRGGDGNSGPNGRGSGDPRERSRGPRDR